MPTFFKKRVFGPDGNPEADPYLIRYVVFSCRLFTVMVHKFLRGDKDRQLHDHPWSFVSLILCGGYWEQTEKPSGVCHCGELVDNHGYHTLPCSSPVDNPEPVLTWFGPGKLLRRAATWKHRVVLPGDPDDPTNRGFMVANAEPSTRRPCWTLVLTGPRVREWGFWCSTGWVPFSVWRRRSPEHRCDPVELEV